MGFLQSFRERPLPSDYRAEESDFVATFAESMCLFQDDAFSSATVEEPHVNDVDSHPMSQPLERALHQTCVKHNIKAGYA